MVHEYFWTTSYPHHSVRAPESTQWVHRHTNFSASSGLPRGRRGSRIASAVAQTHRGAASSPRAPRARPQVVSIAAAAPSMIELNHNNDASTGAAVHSAEVEHDVTVASQSAGRIPRRSATSTR